MISRQRINRERGLTMIELLIAMVIGVFLLAGVVQIFVASRQSYRTGEGLARVQENARLALELLTRDTRMSGFQGCPSLQHVTPNLIASPQSPNPNPTLTVPNLGAALTGNDNVANNWNAAACGASNSCIANSDAITIRFAETCDGSLTGNMGTVNADIQIVAPNSCNLSAYDALLISDCAAADLFIATNVSNGTNKQTIAHANNQNSSNNLSKAYQSDAEILLYREYVYFLRTGAGGEPALWRLDRTKQSGTGTNPIELVEGIENMQITYGEDANSDGSPDYYVSAGSVASMGRVVSIRISLLARTASNALTTEPQTYTYNGNTVTAGDRRLRRVFTTTIGIRNRLQ